MLNKVQIIGNLGADPEIKYLPSGMAISNLNVATTRKWKDKQSGERKEETEWHRVVSYGKQAEIIGQYLKKGSKAYFEGRLKTRKWQDSSGADKYTTEIVAENMIMLDGRSESSSQPRPQVSQRTQPVQSDDFYDSDIPF